MNKEEYLQQLEMYLERVPYGEKMDALRYVDEYFEEAGSGNEEQVIQDLGYPDEMAHRLMVDLPQIPLIPQESYEGDGSQDSSYQEHSNSNAFASDSRNAQSSGTGYRILLVVLTICALPFLAVIFAVLISLVMALLSLVLAFASLVLACVCGVFVYGYRLFMAMPQDGNLALFYAGMFLICCGVFSLSTVLIKAFCIKVLPAVFTWIRKGSKKLYNYVKQLYVQSWKGEQV